MVEHALRAGSEGLIPGARVTKEEGDRVPVAGAQAPARTGTGLGSMEALMAQCQPRLFRFFLLNLRDEDAARSLVQDTFLKAWRSEASFRGECAPSTWLMRIAINLLRDHVRGGKYKFWKRAQGESVDATSLAEVLPSGERGAERILLARERVAAVWRHVEKLSERQRSIFLMRHIDEMELPEIAAATGLPLATVKTHLYRALERVRNGMREGA
jgi:RNA polymerase sigma-70 factor, ECF subfamily